MLNFISQFVPQLSEFEHSIFDRRVNDLPGVFFAFSGFVPIHLCFIRRGPPWVR